MPDRIILRHGQDQSKMLRPARLLSMIFDSNWHWCSFASFLWNGIGGIRRRPSLRGFLRDSWILRPPRRLTIRHGHAQQKRREGEGGGGNVINVALSGQSTTRLHLTGPVPPLNLHKNLHIRGTNSLTSSSERVRNGRKVAPGAACHRPN